MQTLYYGGDIVTMAKENEEKEALIVKDDNIQFVGNYNEAITIVETGYKRVDLKGKTLMPGFIDTHSHISMLAQFCDYTDMTECKSFEEIVDVLKNTITRDDLIVGFGYDHNFLQEQKHPDAFVLDKISEDIPVFIIHSSIHMGVVNHKFLEIVGITKETTNPEGGRYYRDKNGNPTGYIEEPAALMPFFLYLFSKRKVNYVEQIQHAQETYLKYGITTAQDGATNFETVKLLSQLAENGQLKLDVISYVLAEEIEKTRKQFSNYINQYQNHFKIAGVKFVLDGSPQGKSAWLSKPYEGEETYCGYPAHDDVWVYNMINNMVKQEYQILAHCNGDAASEQFLNAYENAIKENALQKELRPVMIHCQTVREDQLERMTKLHMIPSIFVSHVYYWGDVHLRNLGKKRAERISPVCSAKEKGLIYNFHLDTPVLKPNILQAVWCAVNRVTRNGRVLGESQKVSVYDALKAVTCNAAYAYHEETKKGTLEIGKLADFVILSQNPLKVNPMKIIDVQVLQTIKRNKVLYENNVIR